MHDGHNLITFGDDERADQSTAFFHHFQRLDAVAVAALHAVVSQWGALAEALSRDDEKVLIGIFWHDIHAQQLVVIAEAHTHHACSRTAHRSQLLVVGLEAHRHAGLGHEDHVVGFVAQACADYFVAFVKVDGDETTLTRRVVFGEQGLLHTAVARGEHEVLGVFVAAQAEHALNVFSWLEAQKISNMLTLRVARALWSFVRLDAVDAAEVSEEEQPVVGGCGEEVVHHVTTTQASSLNALATAMLGAVVVSARGLQVAIASDGHHDVAVGDEVFVAHIAGERHDCGAAFVTVLFDDAIELFTHDVTLTLRVSENIGVVFDLCHELFMLINDLLTFQSCQAAQLHGQDGVCLDGVDVEQVHKAGAGELNRLGGADEVDDLIDHVNGLQIALQNVVALFRFTLEEGGATVDHFQLVGDPVGDEAVEAERAWHSVDQGEHVGAEGGLQSGVLVQVVEDDLRDGVLLEHEHQAFASSAGGFIAHVGDAFDHTVANSVADGADEAVWVHLVWQLGDDQAHASVDLFGVDDGSHGDEATASAVSLFDTLMAQNRCACWEVWSLDDANKIIKQLFSAGIRVVKCPMNAFGNLAQVVRWDVGCHAHGDACGTVDQKVREACWQHGWLLRLAIVVWHEVDGVLVDVAHHFHGQRCHAALGVTHCCCAVIARGAEVSLAVDQGVAHGPWLGQAHQSVVNSGVAVWVVFTHHVTDNAGALVEAAVRAVAAVVHGVDDAAVHWFQTIANVWQCAFDDDGNGVCQVGFAHFLVEVGALDARAAHQAFEAFVAQAQRVDVAAFLSAVLGVQCSELLVEALVSGFIVVFAVAAVVGVVHLVIARGAGVFFVCHNLSFVLKRCAV